MAQNEIFSTSKAPVTLPEAVTEQVFDFAQKESIITKLATPTTLSLGKNTSFEFTGGIEVGKVDEMGKKPVSSPGFESVSLTPFKVATIVPVTTEALMTDRVGVYEKIKREMGLAVARYLDTLVFHGKDRSTGNEIVGQKSIIGGNSAKIEVSGNDYKAATLAAIGAASAKRGGRPNGVAIDSSAHFGLLSAINETQFGLPNLGGDVVNVAGLPGHVSNTVSWINGDTYTNDKMIVGDWRQVIYGFASDIQWAVSDEASITIGDQVLSAFEHNLKLIRVETFLGATVVDASAFAVVQDATA